MTQNSDGDIIERIRQSENVDEGKKLELELRAREFNKSGWHSPFLIALLTGVIALFANAATTYMGTQSDAGISGDETAAAEIAASRLIDRDEVLEYRSLASDLLLKEPAPGAEERACHYWITGELGVSAGRKLDQLVRKKDLCNASGGGFPELAAISGDPAAELKNECASAEYIYAEATAADQAGFHGKPSAKTTLTLTAPAGHFFVEFDVVAEAYRKDQGQDAREFITPSAVNEFDQHGFPTAFSGDVRCENDRGSGRTCRSHVAIRAKAFPAECAPLFNEHAVTG